MTIRRAVLGLVAAGAIIGLVMDLPSPDTDPALGVWLYRAAASAAVPEPATLLMFGSSLLAVYVSLRRKRPLP